MEGVLFHFHQCFNRNEPGWRTGLPTTIGMDQICSMLWLIKCCQKSSLFSPGPSFGSPTAYSPSQTEVDSSGVPLMCSSVRTWSFRRTNNCHIVSTRSFAGLIKEALLELESLAEPGSMKRRKCESSHCLKDFSELSGWTLCVDIMWIVNIVLLKDCLTGRRH